MASFFVIFYMLAKFTQGLFYGLGLFLKDPKLGSASHLTWEQGPVSWALLLFNILDIEDCCSGLILSGNISEANYFDIDFITTAINFLPIVFKRFQMLLLLLLLYDYNN